MSVFYELQNVGAINVFAGSGIAASTDGQGANASFHFPRGLAIDQQTGILFVSDCHSHTIRKITPQGITMKWFFVC